MPDKEQYAECFDSAHITVSMFMCMCVGFLIDSLSISFFLSLSLSLSLFSDIVFEILECKKNHQ